MKLRRKLYWTPGYFAIRVLSLIMFVIFVYSMLGVVLLIYVGAMFPAILLGSLGVLLMYLRENLLKVYYDR